MLRAENARLREALRTAEIMAARWDDRCAGTICQFCGARIPPHKDDCPFAALSDTGKEE
jgi:hypothetical protein